MFGKVALVTCQYVAQYSVRLCNVAVLCPRLYRFRHAAYDKVTFQFFHQRIEKSVGYRRKILDGIYVIDKLLITARQQKFRKIHCPHVEKIYLADGKTFGQLQSKKRTCRNNAIFRRILAKKFKTIQCVLARLHLIEKYQRVGSHFLSDGKRQIVQNTFNILCRLKKLLKLFLFVEVDIQNAAVKLFAELSYCPRFPHLPCAANNKRFATFRCAPRTQFVKYLSFHITSLCNKLFVIDCRVFRQIAFYETKLFSLIGVTSKRYYLVLCQL